MVSAAVARRRAAGGAALLEAACPEAERHTPCPRGYLAWQAWAQRMARTHHQVRCPGCGLWTIWVAGQPEREPARGPARLRRLLRAAVAVVEAGQGNLRQPAYAERVEAFDRLRDVLEEYGQW